MKVRYVGPEDEREIVATGQVVARGDTADVPDKLGSALCEQKFWERVTPARPKRTQGGDQ